MQLNKIIGLSSQTFNTDVQVAGVELEALLMPNGTQESHLLELTILLKLTARL